MGGERQAAGQQRRHIRGGAHLRGNHAGDREHGPGNADPEQSVIGFDRFKSKTFSKFRGN